LILIDNIIDEADEVGYCWLDKGVEERGVHVLVNRGGFFALKYMLNFLLCAVRSSKFSNIVKFRPVCSITGGGRGISGCTGVDIESCDWVGC
jgi:hypothetical protein